MRTLTLLSLIALLGACGGGGGGGPLVTLSGELTVVAGVPHALAPGADREPNGSAAGARLLHGDAEGYLDAAADRVDVFRVVATGPVSASLEARGFHGDVVLHELASGAVAKSLDLDPGAVYDIVVTARSGAGSYRVWLDGIVTDTAPRVLPERYADCGDGHVSREIVAALVPGMSAGELASLTGLTCRESTDELCLLRAPADGEDFAALCALLARCARLEADGLVRYAEPNFLRRLTGTPNDSLYPSQWSKEQIRAPAAWEHITATARIVAVVDAGIRAHPDLRDQIAPGYDFEESDDTPIDTNPIFSHGTQTAGIVAAAGNNAMGVAGTLWDGWVMPVRAFNAAGFGSSFNIANAIRFAAGLSNSSGTVPAEAAVSINHSFASTTRTSVEEDACDAARAAGVFLAAATGNNTSTTMRFPAGYDSVFAVGATRKDGTRANYSNYGTWLDMVAPGGDADLGVITTGVNSTGQFTYPRVDGTSFACPHVCAVAAMLVTLDDTLTPDSIELILTSTAQDIGNPGYDVWTGHGLLDAYSAVLAVIGGTPPVLIPFEEVEVRLVDVGTLRPVFSVKTSQLQQLQWTLADIGPGRYVLEAGTDRNYDGDISDPGEVFGRYRDTKGAEEIFIAPGKNLSDLDFTIQPR